MFTKTTEKRGFERLNELSKSKDDRIIGGVCGGFAESTPIPAWMWRTIFALTTIFGGFGLFVYLVLWIFMPESTGDCKN